MSVSVESEDVLITSRPQFELARVDTERPMGRGDDQSAVARDVAHQARTYPDRGIQRRDRFVQQRERTPTVSNRASESRAAGRPTDTRPVNARHG